jgi:exosortase A-associated hydrolase 2
MNAPAASGSEAFFMPAGPGERFCLFHPAAGPAARGAILYLHPFAEELNKSRRMAALQSRAFAAAGYSVLQIDLYGCGDSSGEFVQARWHIWKHDLALACLWLAQRTGAPLWLWGLRLGALLALDAARQPPVALQGLILWHPVFKGKSCIDQFLRMHAAGHMLSAASSGMPAAQADQPAPGARRQLAAGAIVEAGGYALAPELAAVIDRQDAGAAVPAMPVYWFDLAAPAGTAGLGAAAARQAAAWRQAGAGLSIHAVDGLVFWSSIEIVECRALLSATAALFPMTAA